MIRKSDTAIEIVIATLIVSALLYASLSTMADAPVPESPIKSAALFADDIEAACERRGFGCLDRLTERVTVTDGRLIWRRSCSDGAFVEIICTMQGCFDAPGGR